MTMSLGLLENQTSVLKIKDIGYRMETTEDIIDKSRPQPLPTNGLFTISSPTINEKDGKAIFVVTNNSDRFMSIILNTSDKTAEAGKDYESISFVTKNLNAGESDTIEVTILKDTNIEKPETFTLDGRIGNMEDFSDMFEGNNANYTQSGTCTILDDEVVTLTVSNPTAYEQVEQYAKFVISLSKPLDKDQKDMLDIINACKEKIDLQETAKTMDNSELETANFLQQSLCSTHK